MRTTKNRRAIIVGIVLALGILIFMVGVFTLGGQKKTFSSTITLKAVFKDVNGLQKGNNIWFSGVKVGTIRSVAFDPDARVIVAMNVEESVQPFIHTDAHAKVSSDGLIGNKIIVIYGGTANAGMVSTGDTLSVENLSSTEGMLDTLQQNNRNLLAITSNFKNISDNVVAGKGSAGRLLTQDEMANTLQASLNSLQVATQHAQVLTANLAAFTARIQTPGTFAHDLVSDTAIFRGLRRSVKDLQAATADIQSVSDKLNSNNSAVGVLLNDPKAAADLQATLRNLNMGTAKLDTNMEALQHNFLLRGFYKKKRKAEAAAVKDAQATQQ
jgi:phospholipid/cholesterol/gamma-HCH transport system substrate-binding protein